MLGRLTMCSLLAAFAAAPLAAQVRDYYENADDARGCIGGSRCGGSRSTLRIRLQDRRVSRVTFRAHDDVGGSRDGRLRVRIDGTLIESSLDISRRPERYTLDVEGLRGRELVFEPASDDEVEIDDVRIDYGGGGGWGGEGGGGEGQSHQGGCIGGSRCGGSRSAIRIALRDRPVREVVFSAHDDIGGSRDGRLRVRIDGTPIDRVLEISRSNERYTLAGNGIRGRELVVEPASNDEVEVRDIEVRYERRGRD